MKKIENTQIVIVFTLLSVPTPSHFGIDSVLEVLGEGSMGRVCRVQKRKDAVGRSSRPTSLCSSTLLLSIVF